MQPVRLEIDRPRYRCDACRKTLTLDLAFLDERRRATRRLVDAIRERCLGTTFRGLAEQTGLAVNTIKNIAQDLIEELDDTVRYETPVIKVANRMGRGYSYEIIRARILYAKHARKVGSLPRPGEGVAPVSTTAAQSRIEYGPHIPTLVELSDAGDLG